VTSTGVLLGVPLHTLLRDNSREDRCSFVACMQRSWRVHTQIKAMYNVYANRPPSNGTCEVRWDPPRADLGIMQAKQSNKMLHDMCIRPP
jgi:hypothetical protein